MRNVLVLLLLVSTSSVAISAESKYFYAFDIGSFLGIHFFSEQQGMLNSRNETIRQELLFKNRSDFYSQGVSPTSQSGRLVNPLLTLEGIVGLKLYNFPFLKGYPLFRRLNGIRLRGGISFYPFASRTLWEYSGPIAFITPNASDPALTEKTYQVTMKVEESLFLILPNFGLYYYHETGLEIIKGYSFFREHLLVPFVGFDSGLLLANGMRKYFLDSKPLNISGNSYQLNARIQENFINDPGYLFALACGAQLQIYKFQFIYIKMGYSLQGASLLLTRRGGFTETATLSNGSFNYTYTDAITKETKKVFFNQSGFFFQLGYSVALL